VSIFLSNLLYKLSENAIIYQDEKKRLKTRVGSMVKNKWKLHGAAPTQNLLSNGGKKGLWGNIILQQFSLIVLMALQQSGPIVPI
jgi:hypothetical protein